MSRPDGGTPWSLPEQFDGGAGASASEHHQSLLVPSANDDRTDVPLGDLLGPLRPLETTPVANWRRGAEGERATAGLLDPLRHLGWAVLHDRRLPGSGANIDHLLIGPGVHVIDSKACRGRIKLLGDGRLWYGRTCLDEVLRNRALPRRSVERRAGRVHRVPGHAQLPPRDAHTDEHPDRPSRLVTLAR